MSATLLDAVRQAAGHLGAEVTEARKLRVLCPRGHCIVNLAVIRLRDGLVITTALDGLDRAEFPAELAEIVTAAPPVGCRAVAHTGLARADLDPLRPVSVISQTGRLKRGRESEDC